MNQNDRCLKNDLDEHILTCFMPNQMKFKTCKFKFEFKIHQNSTFLNDNCFGKIGADTADNWPTSAKVFDRNWPALGPAHPQRYPSPFDPEKLAVAWCANETDRLSDNHMAIEKKVKHAY